MFTWAGMWLCNLAPMHSRTHYPYTNPSQYMVYLHLHKDPPGSLGLGKLIQSGPWVRSEVKNCFFKGYYTPNQTLASLYQSIFRKKKVFITQHMLISSYGVQYPFKLYLDA